MSEEPAVQRVPLRGMRGMIADKLHQSLLGTAQLTHHAECHASALLARKDRLKSADTKVSVEDLLIHATVAMLGKHPGLNGTVVDREIRLASAVHVSIAIALPGNLLVAPTIFHAETKSLTDLASARQDLVARARTNKLSVTEMTGGTFTVSNLGLSRVHFFTPIVNAPQIAILGIGQMVPRPWPTETGGYQMRPVMGLSLTFDHRAIDGAPAAAFLTALCEHIETIE